MGLLSNTCDKAFFDDVLVEQIRVAGEEVRLYSILSKSTTDSDSVDPHLDPLYDEPVSDPVTGNEKFKFKGPYRINAVVKKGSKEVSGEERGLKITREDGSAVFARVTFEREGIPFPKIGDVVEWQGRYYDTTKVDEDGNLADTLTFTKYRCTLRINGAFLPERRADTIDVVAP